MFIYVDLCRLILMRGGNRDTRCKIQDARYRMQDTGCKMQDARCKMQDTGCKIIDSTIEGLGN